MVSGSSDCSISNKIGQPDYKGAKLDSQITNYFSSQTIYNVLMLLKFILVFFILIISFALRFYNLADNFVFTGDEEHQATLAMTIVKDFHLIWIGVNAAHTGFFLGPYWTYFTAIWLWVSGGDPLITGYVAAAIGVVTTGAVIYTGRILFGWRVGIIAGWLYGTLPLLVYFDQKYWNPTLTPLLSILILLSLVKSYKNPWWLALGSFCFGLVFHTHLSLAPLGLIGIYFLFRVANTRILAVSMVAFSIAVLPLIIFDYYHKGSNILTPFRINEISSDSTNRIDPVHHASSFFYSLGRLWYLNPGGDNGDEVLFSCSTIAKKGLDPMVDVVTAKTSPSIFMSSLSIILIFVFIISRKTWREKNHRLLAIFILLISGFFLLFPGGAYEYYLLGIFPLILFIPGILSRYFRQSPTIIIIAVIAIGCLGIFTTVTNKPQFGYKTKQKLVKEVTSYTGAQTIEVKHAGLCHYYEGWRYLLIQNGVKPLRSDSDEGLGWLYQNEISTEKPAMTILFQESRALHKNSVGKKLFSEQGFDVYLRDNN
jgi:hypothetical protein